MTLFDNRYQFLDDKGKKGNFSSVFRAEDVQTHHEVAVKRLRDDLPDNKRGWARQMFRREAAVLSRLHHERIPRLHTASLDGNSWYLVLDFIEGTTLKRHLKKQGILLLEEVLSIGMQLCDILAYLHEHHPPIKFRDLNPANIILSPSGHVYLIDFGLARSYRPGQVDAKALGTPGYAAPEQYPTRHGSAKTTPQSDVYSLGVVLHQLISGEDPTKKVLPDMFTFSELSDKTTPLMAELVARMLKRNPDKRRSIMQVWATLREISLAASTKPD